MVLEGVLGVNTFMAGMADSVGMVDTAMASEVEASMVVEADFTEVVGGTAEAVMAGNVL
jgi:hypothetical protein